MYLYDKNRVTYFAETDRRNKRIPFGIKAEDRTKHMYIIGKTGMGKSTMIENMAVQDIKNGEGFAFIDPHGKSASLLLDYIPAERIKDVIYFAPFDMEFPISFNVMEDIGPDKRHLIANGLMSAFKKIWGPETWSDRMQYILANSILALLEYPDSTLLGVNRMLTDKAYRKKVVDNVKDPSVKAYWTEEFAKYTEKFAAEATPAIQNKLGQFTSNPLIRNIIGQPHSSFDLRKVMDERKILIVNLSKGQLGEGNANLLGGMIITKIYLAAMSRADLSEAEMKRLPNFYMYVDEFQSFANESFADILSEARKYKLALVMAHQYIEQMDEKVSAAVFGNVGTQIMFRVGATDAEFLEKEYAPVFTAEDMVSLGFTQIYLKLMIDGVASHPFSAVTLPPILPPEESSKKEVMKMSRELYGHEREKVEEGIMKWYGVNEGQAVSAVPQAEKRDTPPRQESPNSYPPRESKPYGDTRQNKTNERSTTPPRLESSPHIYRERAESPRRNPETTLRTERVIPPQNNTNNHQTSISNSATESSLLRREEDVSRIKTERKLEKPFAQAFKDAVRESPDQKERTNNENKDAVNSISLSSLERPKGAHTEYKKNTQSPENLNNLKSALADVLREEKKKDAELKKEEPKERVEAKQAPREENTNTRAKEVPEDVLTAILRGED
ncbi:MAG: type IV secretion system DNA-binding domain-containing protein [Patescibacteria group bacterium]